MFVFMISFDIVKLLFYTYNNNWFYIYRLPVQYELLPILLDRTNAQIYLHICPLWSWIQIVNAVNPTVLLAVCIDLAASTNTQFDGCQPDWTNKQSAIDWRANIARFMP